MARVSIYYDNNKKEQFFMVRGDERYARSTKTLLELVSTNQELFDFDAVFSVNVLRDTGDGSIVVMDNDVAIPVLLNIEDNWVEFDSIPWNSQLNGLTFKLNHMTYDTDHNLTAKYIGNKSCSPSLSNTVLVNIEDTHRTVPVITIESTTQYDKNTTISKSITLTNDISEELNKNQTLIVYYDNQKIGQYNTGNTGIVTNVQIPSGAGGLHTLTVEFKGSNNLTPKTVTQQISVGYKLELTEYPSVMVHSESYEFKGILKDWFGNPKPNATVILQYLNCYEPYIGQWSDKESATTNDNGEITITHNNLSTCNTYRRLKCSVGGETYSEQALSNTVQASQLNIAADAPRLYKGESNMLRITTNSPYENTPIHLTGAVNETIYTGANGFVAIKTLTGEGEGTKTITATFGNLTQTINLEDYIQYWSPNDIHPNPKIYELDTNGTSTILDLTNYFRLDVPNTNLPSSGTGIGIIVAPYTHLLIPVRANVDFELEIQGVRSNGYCQAYPIIQGTNKSNYNYGGTPANGAFNGGTMNIIRRDGVLKTNFTDGSGNVIHNEWDPIIARGNTIAGFVFRYDNKNITSGRFTQISFTKLTLQEL